MTTEPPLLFKPSKRHSAILASSPARHRLGDDILAHVAPDRAVDALTAPVGALKACLDMASPAERDFAMRTAVASQTIWEWVEELSEWDWPADGGSAGFELPPHSNHLSAPDARGLGYMGSLPARDVAAYERRVNDICCAVDELAVDDIKAHVLTNHIMPLSRPNTPMTESSGPSSLSSYNKMEDLTVAVTAIVVQTLPNLARLSRLLQMWSVRVAILQRVPALMDAIDDAEAALAEAWAALAQPRPPAEAPGRHQPCPRAPTRDDFDAARLAVARRLAEPGRMLDYMLDCLEGLQDTLPDRWLDRMEAVERGYGEWVAACEGRMREAEWMAATPVRPRASDGHVAGAEPPSAETSVADPLPSVADPSPSAYEPSAEPSAKPAPPVDHVPASPETARRTPDDDAVSQSPAYRNVMTPVEEEDELELPPLRNRPSHDSLASQASTTIGAPSSHFGALSSDSPQAPASPGAPRDRACKTRYADDSPPSSPPLPATDAQDASAALLASPVITPTAAASMFSKGPADQSFVDDFDDALSMSEVTSPMLRRESSGDQQLRQQISEIIESIPAAIKLTPETEPVNLNPPDIQLPRLRKKPSREPAKRSASSLSAVSSRTTTPSFTLSPARNARPRHRGQQEIRVYHLSRSTGEPPIKLFIRCVGEHGERVMVRVGGGWADLSEYLKEYAAHHGRRSAAFSDKSRVEVRDVPRSSSGLASHAGSSPPRPASMALDSSPMTPLRVPRARRSVGSASGEASRLAPKTPAGASHASDHAPSSEESVRSRASSRLSWVDDDSSFLGLAGPTGKKVEMSEESRMWVESIKEKVRLASGEWRPPAADERNKFGELGRVGGTKRLFRKADERSRR